MKPAAVWILITCIALLLAPACDSDSTAAPDPTSTVTPTTPPTSTQTADPSTFPTATTPVPISRHYTYRIINSYPHDPEAFTQGLVFTDGVLYEGTGLRGNSSLRKVDLETGEVLQQIALTDEFFGEGIVVYEDRIVQLTWQSHVAFIYDKQTFERLGEFTYPTEGWGITSNGERLIMSDGSATLHFLDPETFKETGTIEATDENGPVTRLNELEYIEGLIYANVWMTDTIVIIDPDTGSVTSKIDLTGLLDRKAYAGQQIDVLNGIAYDSEHDRLFVTGKLWPRLFEIDLVPIG